MEQEDSGRPAWLTSLRSRIGRKTAIILSLSLLLLVVVVVCSVLLSVTRLQEDSSESPVLAGDRLVQELSEQELSAVVNAIGDIQDGTLQKLIAESKMASMNGVFQDIVVNNLRAVGGIIKLDLTQQPKDKKRMVRDILQVVLEDKPTAEALTYRKMGVDAIFDDPLDEDFSTWKGSNMTVDEIVRSKEFQERLKKFIELTDGMGVMHVESTGSDVGEDLVDEVDKEMLEKDVLWLHAIQDILVNLTKEEGYNLLPNTSILEPEDLETLDRMWEVEIKGRREFGISQLRNELQDLNGVRFAEPEKEMNHEEIKEIRLKLLRDRLLRARSSNRAPLGRMGDDGQPLALFVNAVCDPISQESCADGLSCYFKSEHCDRSIHCPDNSDERQCKCKDYLPAAKLCDGFEDCVDGQDELNCNCPEGTFYCGESELNRMAPHCIDSQLRCDNIVDCPSGADEDFCYQLSPSPDVADEPHNDGFLHIRTNQGWKILSLELTNPDEDQERLNMYLQRVADDVCKDSLTFPASAATYEIVANPIQAFQGDLAHVRLDFNAETEGEGLVSSREGGRYYFEFLPPHPDSIILKVMCGPPVCGMQSDRRTDEVESTLKDLDRVNDDFLVRIVGGDTSTFGHWPFTVGLTKNGRFICGATIVDSLWVLTAAHCVQDFQSARSHFQVIAGLHRRFSRSNMEQVRVIDLIRIHSAYNSTWLKNDIALARVSHPFDLNYAVSPICLPDSSLCISDNEKVQAPRPGDVCVSVGWGKVSEGGRQSDQLRQVTIPILSSCPKSYNDIEYQVCGGYEEGGKDSCQGDSGGPMFCQNPDRPGAWYLGGIISHGIGCARANAPGVYTRVCKFTEWIQEILQEESKLEKILERDSALDNILSFSANTVCPTLLCDSGRCVDEEDVCNLWVSCFDGRDEQFCITNESGDRVIDPNADLELTTPIPIPQLIFDEPASAQPGSIHEIQETDSMCPAGHFQCKKIFQCVPEPARCNSKIQCMDMSDELGCKCRDYLLAITPSQICDGHPDCADWSDEIGCNYCMEEQAANPGVKMYYCNLSKKCIAVTQLCDGHHDCDMREDERYCINVVNGDRVQLGLGGRPVQHVTGLLAMNTNGVWRAVCAEKWDEHINDRVCRYTGKREAVSFSLINQALLPHLGVAPLEVTFVQSTRPIFPREARHFSLQDVFLQSEDNVTRSKRQSSSCQYVNTECSPFPTCGVMPLYNFLGQDTPAFGPGVFPWTATLYLNGKYLCGATLVHQDWVLIGEGCAVQVDPPFDYVIARLGGYRDGVFKSAYEELRRVVQITKIPRTEVYLGRFSESVRLSEFINVICIPNARWIPTNTECVITGRLEGSLNHAFETFVEGQCPRTDQESQSTLDNFDICAREAAHTNECLEKWSGALACPDGTGRYYAIGVFYSEDGGCDGNPPPNRFTPLVTRAARSGIVQIIQTAEDGPSPYHDLKDSECDNESGDHQRCPLGNCIGPANMCNGFPDCNDVSDEDLSVCLSRGPVLCSHVNSTHCQCPSAGDMLCRNQICVSRSVYCDGTDDCGDGSDEPPGCEKDCAVGLDTMDPDRLCDGVVDCKSLLDIGNDESASRCCPDPDQQYRCMLGTPRLFENNIGVLTFQPEQCLSPEYVCDSDPEGRDSCKNGADESDCLSLWSGNLLGSQNLPKDAFGRFKSQAEGYLYYVSNGKTLMYCAGPSVFAPERRQIIGEALCRHENYKSLTSITLHEPSVKQSIRPDDLDPSEEKDLNNCQLVYIVCAKDAGQM